MFLYYSLFPPLVYLVFMAKFFQTAEHWPLIRGGPGWNLDEKADENDPETQRRLERRLELQRWMAEQEQKHRATVSAVVPCRPGINNLTPLRSEYSQ